MESDEDGADAAKPQDATPDLGVAPPVDTSAPLEGQNEADNGTDEEKGTKQVHLSDLLASGESAMLALWVLEEEEDGRNRTTSEREIDPQDSLVTDPI